MCYKLVIVVFGAIVLIISVTQSTAEHALQPVSRAEFASHDNFYGVGCDNGSGDIQAALMKLETGEHTQIEQARNTLLGYSRKSPVCRKEVVWALMNVMDRPDLDFRRDAPAYYVWREGSRLLGELRATEALDLLISHLDVTHEFHSASMVFQPAILGVRQMGEAAIPKLAVALRESPKTNIRMAAVYCLTSIGGAAAMDVLKQAQNGQTNKCVSRFIDISLSTFSYKSKSGYILFDNDAPQAGPSARRNWLTAFECVE
jgi:hypothetical protein